MATSINSARTRAGQDYAVPICTACGHSQSQTRGVGNAFRTVFEFALHAARMATGNGVPSRCAGVAVRSTRTLWCQCQCHCHVAICKLLCALAEAIDNLAS